MKQVRNRMKIYPLLLFITLHTLGYAQKGKVLKLDLQASIELAKEQSFAMRKIREDLNFAKYNLKAATSAFKTHVNLDLTLPSYSERVQSLQTQDGLNFFWDKQLYYSGELSVEQPLPTDGTLSLSSGMFNTEDYDQDERFTQLTTSIQLIQPIQSLYAYNAIKSNFKRAKLNYDLYNKQLKREELDVIYKVTEVFYNLHATKEQLGIRKRSKDRLEEAFEIAQNKYKAGLIREVEALQIEVDLGDATNQLDEAKVNYNNQLNIFKQVIGIPLHEKVELISDFEYEAIHVDVPKAIKKALDNRIEIKQKQLLIDLDQIDLKKIKAQGTISGNLKAYYDFIGMDRYDINSSLKSAFHGSWNNLKDRPGNFGVALTLKIPIIDWGENRAKVKAKESQITKKLFEQEEESIKIERQVIALVNNLHSSLRKLQLLEKNMKLAEKSFAISQKRFANGDIDNQSLALDRNRLDNTYLSRLQAYSAYKLQLADLMRSTFYDFEKDIDLVY